MPRIYEARHTQAVWEVSFWRVDVPDEIPEGEVEAYVVDAIGSGDAVLIPEATEIIGNVEFVDSEIDEVAPLAA